MSDKLETEMLVRTIDRAIEQARDLGMPLVAHILMMARIEADPSKEPTNIGTYEEKRP